MEKVKYSIVIKVTTWICIGILVVFIGHDLMIFRKSPYENKKLNNYLKIESDLLDSEIHNLISMARNEMMSKSNEFQKNHNINLHLDSISNFELRNHVYHIINDKGPQYYTSDLKHFHALENAIENSVGKPLQMFYEKVYHKACLEFIIHDLGSYDTSGDVISIFQCTHPITEDSIYFGTYGISGTKLSVDINNQKFNTSLYNEYTIKTADTLNIVSELIVFDGSKMDTIRDRQIIAKRSNRWWNVESPDPVIKKQH